MSWRLNTALPTLKGVGDVFTWTFGNVIVRETSGVLDITGYPEKITDAVDDDLFITADSQDSFVHKKIKKSRLGTGGTPDLTPYFHKTNDDLDDITAGLTNVHLTSTLKTNYDAAYSHSGVAHAPADAEKNVQADWNQADSGADSYILNKPTITTPPTTEEIQDIIGAMVTGNTETGISITYDDVNGKLDAVVTASGAGDVTGPASATDNAITRFDGLTGKAIQNSSATIDDNGSVNIPSGQKYKINNVDLAAADVGAEPANANIQSHISSTSNPHSVTASQAGAVATNVAITPGTKTKITYDAKGLVTSGADAGISDITNLQTTLDSKEVYHGIQTAGALSFNNSTHILSVAGTVTYWFAGTKYTTASAVTCDIDSFETLTTNTLYYFYFDDASGTLKCSDAPWSISLAYVQVATVFWNGSAGSIYKEFHNHTRDLDWHKWAHDTIGTRYESGLSLTNPTTANDALLQIESGGIHDEDQDISITQQTTMRGWYKASANVYTFADYALPYLGTSGQPQYLDTDTYTLTNVGANDFACYWLYATIDVDRPIAVIPTHAAAAYGNLVLARAETVPTLSGLNLNPEWKLIYRFIYKGDGNFQESNDYRQTSPLPSGGAASTTASAVSFNPTGNISASTVQTAIEELDTEKQAVLVSGTNIKTINSTTLLGSGDIAIVGLTDGDKGDITIGSSGTTMTIDNGVVTEAKLSIADNTTGNVSTSAHGFAPKGVNDVQKFLRSDASYAIPTILDLGALSTTNETYSGIISTETVDTNSVGFGCVLAIAADGNYDEADADAIANAYNMVLALETGTGTKKVLRYGRICDTDWTWTVGGTIYLSTTLGTMTQTAPTGADDTVIILGWATHADAMIFSPYSAHMEHTG